MHWELIGNPAVGAAISFHGTQADVIGHAVMTLSYRDSSGSRFKLQKLRYRTTVDWNNGDPKVVTGVGLTDVEPKKTSIARPSIGAAALAQVPSAVRAAFNHCVASHQVPMPPTCPRNPDTDLTLGHATWSMDGDPLLNTTSTYDAAWGLVHLKGNFAFRYSYHFFLGGIRTQYSSGTYDAVVAADEQGVNVLQINEV